MMAHTRWTRSAYPAMERTYRLALVAGERANRREDAGMPEWMRHEAWRLCWRLTDAALVIVCEGTDHHGA
jgi:hypothetical protein